jgi:hypothetical protein
MNCNIINMNKQINRYKIINVIATLNSIKKIGVSPIIEMLINICIRKLKLEIQH